MEKKGEIFNQLAIIADLLENVNLESKEKSVIIVLSQSEFDIIFDKIVRKTKILSPELLKSRFSLKIGEVDFVFSLAKD